jgi:tyrosine-protein kinase Etk/Wzc
MERLREYKYREALFDVYARQFELARADEAREGALIQVVDPATAPERKVWPQRGVFTLLVIVVSTLLAGLLVVWRGSANHRAEVA